MMDDELIEKVARVIYEIEHPPTSGGWPWKKAPTMLKEESLNLARAAIQAVREWDREKALQSLAEIDSQIL